MDSQVPAVGLGVVGDGETDSFGVAVFGFLFLSLVFSWLS